MNKILKELEKALFEYNNPQALSISRDILKLIDIADCVCLNDLDDDYITFGSCTCLKCLKQELEDETYWEPFYPENFYNSAFLN